MDTKWTKRHALILNQFINEIDKLGIKYFILRYRRIIGIILLFIF